MLKVIFILCLSVVSGICLLPERVFALELTTTEAALKQVFPRATGFQKKMIALSADQEIIIQENAAISFEGGAHSKDLTVYLVRQNDKIDGFAFEDTVIGKWGPIRYLVGLNPSGAVIQVVVLEYREIRGRPVAKKRFLNQYKGKTVHDEIMLRSDIDGITGATISSRSMTDGVRKIVHVFDVIKESFPNDS